MRGFALFCVIGKVHPVNKNAPLRMRMTPYNKVGIYTLGGCAIVISRIADNLRGFRR